jgi:hypothetical protein
MVTPTGGGLGHITITPKESLPGTLCIPQRKTHWFRPCACDGQADPTGGILQLIKGAGNGIKDLMSKHRKRMKDDL